MKTIYLNVPTKDRKEKDIQYTINKTKNVLSAMFEGEELKFVDNCLTETECSYMKHDFNEAYGAIKNEDLMYTGYGIQKLAGVDIVATFNCTGIYSRECVVVESAARIYGINLLVIDDIDGEIYVPDIHEANVKKRQNKQVSNEGFEEGEINY